MRPAVTTLPGPGPFFWRVLGALPRFGGRRCRMLVLEPKRSDLEELHARGKIVVRP